MNLNTASYLAPLQQRDNPRASASGITVAPCVGAGWRCVLIHPLTDEENEGSHNVYIDAIDTYGRRFLPTANQMRFGWENMQPNEAPPPAIFEKNAPEPGANIPLFAGQNLWIEMQDVAGAPSDRVSGMSLIGSGHRSYYVVFQLVSSQQDALLGRAVSVPADALMDVKARLRDALAIMETW